MNSIFKLASYTIYLSFGYFVVGKLVDYNVWGILFAVPMGVLLAAAWIAREESPWTTK